MFLILGAGTQPLFKTRGEGAQPPPPHQSKYLFKNIYFKTRGMGAQTHPSRTVIIFCCRIAISSYLSTFAIFTVAIFTEHHIEHVSFNFMVSINNVNSVLLSRKPTGMSVCVIGKKSVVVVCSFNYIGFSVFYHNF